MKRLLWLGLAAAVSVGCQGSDSTSVETAPGQVVQKPKDVGAPVTTSPTKICLVLPKTPLITVGYPAPTKIFDYFRDPKKLGNEYSDLPTNFTPPYGSRIWETAHKGFGEITYNDNLVAAMYQEGPVTEDQVQEIVAAHKNQLGPQDIPIKGNRVRYWFWEKDGQRLMICAFQTERQGLKLTLAMGDDAVLEGLGISPANATADAAKLDSSTGLPTQSKPIKATP